MRNRDHCLREIESATLFILVSIYMYIVRTMILCFIRIKIMGLNNGIVRQYLEVWTVAHAYKRLIVCVYDFSFWITVCTTKTGQSQWALAPERSCHEVSQNLPSVWAMAGKSSGYLILRHIQAGHCLRCQ